jgi:hypothetical protein
MPITVNFQGRPLLTQNINNDYNIKNYDPDDFVSSNDFDKSQEYVNRFITNYKEKKEIYRRSLRSQNISYLPDYSSAIYFGIDLNNIDADTIQKIKKINEINAKETPDSDEPCINMIKYTRICDSAIIPCRTIIDSTREFDAPIIPCKFMIHSIRQIDSQFVKNQLLEIQQKPPRPLNKPQKPSTGPLDSIAISQKPSTGPLDSIAIQQKPPLPLNKPQKR